jgi:hypothetical protein
LKNEVASIEEVIATVATTTNITTLVGEIRSGNAFSIRLFELHSRDEDRFFANCFVKSVSDWAFQRLVDKYEERQGDAARKIYDLLRWEPEFAFAIGNIWKRQCHRFFRSLQISRHFNLRSLDDPNQTITWDFPGGVEYQEFETASFSTELEARIRLGAPTYFQPLSASYPTLDSLLYRPGRLDFLQMTDAKRQPSKIAGFERIQRGMKLKGPASNLRPSKQHPWILIFVLSEEKAASFKKQPFGKDWDSKVKQYVLTLSQKDVWEI